VGRGRWYRRGGLRCLKVRLTDPGCAKRPPQLAASFISTLQRSEPRADGAKNSGCRVHHLKSLLCLG
jgi:hypothetical protein